MDIPMNQIHFGLCSMKKSMQNYKRLAISIHKMVPAKFASQHCIFAHNIKSHYGTEFIAVLLTCGNLAFCVIFIIMINI